MNRKRFQNVVIGFGLGAAVLLGLYMVAEQAATEIADEIARVSQVVDVTRKIVTERVIDLPEDGRRWSSVFVWPKDKHADADSRRLAAMFATTPRLQSLLAQTKTFNYTPDSEIYRERFASKAGGRVPQFWLVRPDPDNPSTGTLIYKVSGSNMPASGDAMADEIAQMIRDKCGTAGPCPRPNPNPNPNPSPDPNEPIPDLRPDGDTDQDEDSGLPGIVYLLPLLFALGGALAEYKKSQ